MLSCRFYAPGRLEMEEVPTPKLGPGELLVRVAAAGICGSDLRVYLGEKGATPGTVLGHEFAGVVAEAGPGVEGYVPGQRVAVWPVVTCGQCYFCTLGRGNRCLKRLTLGYERDGGLAEYVRLPAALVGRGQAVLLPAGLPLERAALTEPLACTLNSLEACGVGPGSQVAILGAGPMGLLHVALARSMGASRILVSDPLPQRREAAQALGATDALDPARADLRGAVLEATEGLGADAVIVTAGRADLVATSLGLVRKQGVVNLFAGFPPQTAPSFDVNLIHYNEVRLTGTQNATLGQFRRSVPLLERLPELDTIITHRYPLAEAKAAFESRVQLQGLKALVLPDLLPGG